ncbi:hypothetical protein PGUG_03528 [Meyerozyma guilliermondii ATCC 6260]|uniref:Uncharacterized protein n=1 Tax=Meyerozyma guilliermondii (strain ATCC 6260 / CBS 566 / DSM 6381 / JCM 1539 / NBRC 10279 / NRRL Y-324) TaxID=294746 RepID=A5DJS7_PICGU|nr:uncharacterized protein PGUG_03528 [Meyerozyma guilliermondii ATCC 6260]EDK39430.2 hypothetical protein PGUG_03528 [Meyerozyma guilliermondii ATCC 6260]
MATVTASKKKLVYKQGPDGVFRLKKVDDKDGDGAAGGNSAKKGVNDYLNELIGCAYEVQSDLNDKPVDSAPPSSSKPPPLQTRHTSPANPNTFTPNAKKANSKRTVSPTSSDHSIEPELPPPVVQIKSMVGLHFHIPSFLLGAVSSVVLVHVWPLLAHYTVIALGFAKLGVLWGTVLGVICWYCGLIKIQDASTLRQLARNISSYVRPLPTTNQPRQESPEYDSEDMMSVDSDVAVDESNGQTTTPIPPKQVRRNTLTRVTPFKYSSPRDKYSSNPELPTDKKVAPKLNRGFTTDPRQYSRRHSSGVIPSRSRQNSSQSLDLMRPRTNTSQESSDSASYKHKNLPPVSDDLPFINEVKLISHEEMAGGAPDIRRSDTMMSKKSILGTTANYNKFLANVQDDDFD